VTESELTTLMRAAGEPEPALPADFVADTLGRSRRSVRIRRGLGGLVAVAVVGLVVALLPLVPHGLRAVPPAAPAGRPALPTEFADYSSLTSRAIDRPAGRAIALYEYGSSELFHSWQTLVVGADADTYRRVDNGDDDPAPPVLLSPDGTSVLYFHAEKGTDEFTLLDLTTGHTRTLHSVPWTSNVGGTVTMLAWSPDGRYVAYSVPSPPNGGPQLATDTQLALLDVVHDTTVRYPAYSPVDKAAFAPDSLRLAVQTGPTGEIVSVRGERLGIWVPGGNELAGPAAWSPDGRLLATVVPPEPRLDGSTSSTDSLIRFVSTTGVAGAALPDRPGYDVLGWTSPTTYLTDNWLTTTDAEVISEVSTLDGRTRVVSRFSQNAECEFGLQVCNAYRIQLATGLLTPLNLRLPDPDRGPLVPLVHIGLSAGIPLLVGGLVAWWAIRRRRRRATRRVRAHGPQVAGRSGA
jgi:hypothetical protein